MYYPNWTWRPLIPALPGHDSLKPWSHADWLLVSLGSSHSMLCWITAPSSRQWLPLHDALMVKIYFKKEDGVTTALEWLRILVTSHTTFQKSRKAQVTSPTLGDPFSFCFYFFQVHVDTLSPPSILRKIHLTSTGDVPVTNKESKIHFWQRECFSQISNSQGDYNILWGKTCRKHSKWDVSK